MAANGGKLVWVGRVLSFLPMLLFIFSAVMKFKGGPDLEKGMEPLGLPMSMVKPLGVLELACVIAYLIPQTAVIGAILLTGYMGGAILTHWRVGDPVYTHIVLGLLIWLGLWLRDARLRELMPIRKL